MKNRHKKIILFTIVLSVILFGKCSILEQDINGELSAFLNVDESNQGQDIQYANTMILSADSDEDIGDNLDKIKDWSVTEVSFSVSNYYGDPGIIFSGSLGFSKRSASSASITTSVANLDIGSISDDGKKYKLNLSEAQLATIAGYFNDDQAIKVYLNGVLSQGPMGFGLEIFAKVKVKAKVL